MSFIIHLKKLDWILIFTSLLLVGFGLLSLYSSSIGREDFGNFQKQLIFFAIGILGMLAISFLDYRVLRNDPYFLLLLYGIGVIALAGLLVFAPEIRGTQGWYRIGVLTIDPTEYIKIVLILLMAKYLSTRHVELYRAQHILLSGFYFAAPALLIFLQPELGSALILLGLWIVMLLVSGIRLLQFLAIVGMGLAIFSFGWSVVLQDYQKNRLISFVEPELDPLGIGWSQLQAKISIGNGGIWGQGIGGGTQTQYGFLSEPQTDFIFAAISEEFGFAGVLLLLFLFLVLVGRILRIGMAAQSNFPRLFANGFAILLAVQVMVNVGMNLGFLPIIGIPLPMVSYGGSSLLMSFVGLGILQSIRTH